MHGNYYYMVEGSPHVWAINVHSNYKNMVVDHKIHLKIPACESQHCLQSNLSQTHSYHGVKRHTVHDNHTWEPHINQDSQNECCTLTVHRSHTLKKIPTLNATP